MRNKNSKFWNVVLFSRRKPKGTTLPADQYRYVVQEKGKSNITITVPAKQVRLVIGQK